MAAQKRMSAGQIINALRKAEVGIANGKRIKEVCRELGVSKQTYYRWRRGVRRDEDEPGEAAEGAREGDPALEASDVPPSMVPLPMLDLELSVVPEGGAF